MTEPPILSIRALSLGFGDRVLLEDLAFDVPRRGVLALLGPAGVGKSTLLRTLARRAELLPSFWVSGHVWLGDLDLLHDVEPAEARRHVALFAQKTRLHTASVLDNVLAALPAAQLGIAAKRARALEILDRAGLLPELGDRLDAAAISLPLGLQRRLSLARIVAADPAVMLVDEPLRDLPPGAAARLEEMLVAEARRRALVVITHDLTEARRIASSVVLLVASRQIAHAPASRFFTDPPDPVSRRFVKHGNAWPAEVPARAAAPESASAPESAAAPEPPRRRPAARPQASSFQWVIPDLLGGMARPGLVNEEEQDLVALRALGVRRVVSLEPAPYPAARLAEVGIAGAHLPISDMEAPSIEVAYAVIVDSEAWLARGGPTVYHCKGGLGRTGTLLAAHLIVRGMAPLHALEELRSIHPRYVQSIAQELFLDQLAVWLRGRA